MLWRGAQRELPHALQDSQLAHALKDSRLRHGLKDSQLLQLLKRRDLKRYGAGELVSTKRPA